MYSMDDEWDRDIVGDLLLPWGAGSKSGDGELDHNGSTDDCEVDRIGSGIGERTTSASGVNIIIMGDGETNANLGDGVWDRDGAYDDGEVDRTGSGGGEGTNSAGGVKGVIVGDEETNDSLGDGMWGPNGYQQSRRV